jgi:hypothetical protein
MKNGIEMLYKSETGDIKTYAFWYGKFDPIPELDAAIEGLMVTRIIRLTQLKQEVCPDCNGEGEAEPCCKGNVYKINCACHGRPQVCDTCNGDGVVVKRERPIWET